jgi:hypothetical protein
MSAIKRFSAEQIDALQQGRAIPLLIEYRDSEFPDHSLSVIGQMDDGAFWGILVPDDDPDCELVTIPMTSITVPQPYPIASDAPDAQAIHRLWSEWEGGVRDAYIALFRRVGRRLARERMMEALDRSSMPASGDTA